jgi:hypothetical protein
LFIDYKVSVQRTYYNSQSLPVICCSAGDDLDVIAAVNLQMSQGCQKLLHGTEI